MFISNFNTHAMLITFQVALGTTAFVVVESSVLRLPGPLVVPGVCIKLPNFSADGLIPDEDGTILASFVLKYSIKSGPISEETVQFLT